MKSVLEGKAKIWEQEGGFATPSVSLNGVEVTNWLRDYFGVGPATDSRIGSVIKEGDVDGVYRLTLERLK